ncbi:alanine--glyoxylate aminotransferase family protein [bacterium]|nr:alanine--glyoxylate aminotransferase family protein [bacterium]MBU3956559.1 alanine--glyoxylate aminotransferase family protein [bacterium]MBU4134333.1 alanine--glyoxylate aminotransferase family protein [bacterium]
MKKEILFSPGPTNVPAEILLEGAKRTIHHRTKEFSLMLGVAEKGLAEAFDTKGKVFILTSSGSGAMEAAVVNFLSRNDDVLVLNTGAFGRRWANIAKAYGIIPDVLEYPWGESFKIADVEEKIKKKNYRAILCQLGETSTGAVNDIKSLGEIIPKKTILIVDAVSGLMSEEFHMDKWNVDVCVSGSQKGFMMPPGLAFIAVRKGLDDEIGKSDLPCFYFSLKQANAYLEKGQTPWTPAINLIYQLNKSLEMLSVEGFDNVITRHKNMAQIARKSVSEMGLELFSSSPSNGITAVKVPDGIDGTKLIEYISEKYGVRFANGQREYKGKLLRIAHMGYVTVPDILMALNCLWLGLKKSGFKTGDSAIVSALEEALSLD